MTMMIVQVSVIVVCALALAVGLLMRSKSHDVVQTPQSAKPAPVASNAFNAAPLTRAQVKAQKSMERRIMRRKITSACQTLSLPHKPQTAKFRALHFLRDLDAQWQGLINNSMCRVFKGQRPLTF